MNLLTHIMSYDKGKSKQENCDCKNCVSIENVESKNQIIEYSKLSEEEIEKIISERYSNKDEKTKTFIRKALRKHGNRYDYSNVVYIKSSKHVEIICRVEGHESFPQTPNKHLIGRGCPICGGSKKLTTTEFIERANIIHGIGRYDYSKVKYININTEVIIICLKHGDFLQTPLNHLKGEGCRKCQYKKLSELLKFNTEEFIERANEVHGEGTYDYSKVNYIDMRTEVIIICPNHNILYEFPQTPSHHLGGSGCPICGGTKKLTTEEFIEKANEIHGVGTYGYSKVNYITNRIDVIITCPKHGDFPQKPANHLIGEGCRKCNKNKGEEAIRKFLNEKEIEFEEQKKFEGCKYKQQLRFDFYIPKYNLCIESDGIPHFEKVNWNGKMTDEEMEKLLKSNQFRDKIKNDYCKKNGIILLRVNNLKAVEELSKYFQNL